jgi:hypothetical protein
VFVSPFCSTTKTELALLVCFSRPTEEDNVLFGVVVLEAMGMNYNKE